MDMEKVSYGVSITLVYNLTRIVISWYYIRIDCYYYYLKDSYHYDIFFL